jgi:uncharacterized protein (TIGR02611 family)
MAWQRMNWVPNIRWLKRAIVAVVGFTVLLVGIAMIVLPGPAFIVIPLGLAILATEFVWAARLLQRARARFKKKGACAKCGKPIEKNGLSANPPATLCLSCRKMSDPEARPPSSSGSV